MKKAWAFSLIAIGLATIVMFGPGLVGVELPNAIFRAAGCVDLIALPIFAFATVQRLREKR